MRWMHYALTILLVVSLATTVRARQQNATAAPPATGAQLPRPLRIRVGSNVAAAKLVSRVDPVYPTEAIRAHISGTVTLHVVIATDGAVKEADVVSGPDVFKQSSIHAVKQWRYQQTLLNGQPVEVDTTVLVVYDLGGAPGGEQTPAVQIPGGETVEVPAETPPTDPQLKTDILKLLDAMHVQEGQRATFQNLYQNIRPMILRTLPDTPNKEKIADAYGEKLESLLTSSDYTDALIRIYAKSLSDDDVKGLTAFYGTPAGQHYLAAAPQITSDAASLGMRIAASHIMEIFKSLCSEYPELQSKASFCPPNHTKTSELGRSTGRGLGD